MRLSRSSLLFALAFGFVLLAVAALSLVPFARANTWNAAFGIGDFSPSAWSSFSVWAACALAAFFFARRFLPGHDPYLLPVTYLLTGWGLVIIQRLTPETPFGLRQTAWLIIATALMLGVMALPGDLRWLRRYRYTWLAAGLTLTALTFVLGVNPSGAGQRLWLGLGQVLYLQPAEFLKLVLVVFLAAYLADRREQLFQSPIPTDLHPSSFILHPSSSFVYFSPLLLMWGLSMLLLISQRDLGMGTLLFAIFLVMLYLASGQLRYLVIGAGLMALGGLAGYYLFDVVRLRVEAWWNPWLDPAGRSYQIVQSLTAFAAGGLFGRGLGLGTPTLIPVAHSDFIFAAVAEEWGLAGVVGVVSLLGIVVFRGLRIALQAQGAFRHLLAGGLAALLGLQALMIMGGVVKLVPLTGLTLPFMSYGGSSLVTAFCAIGLLLRLSVSASHR